MQNMRDKTYRSQTKITKGPYTCIRIEQEIRWFDVAMDDAPGVYIAQRAKQTSEVRFDAF